MHLRGLRALAVASALCGIRSAAGRAPLLTDPPVLASVGGVLSGTLTVAPGTVTVAGKRVETTLYDGRYVPPVLRMQPGDRVRLRLVNASADQTNLHYHGFTVTPLLGGDDAFLDVRPGASFDYDFQLPAHHAQGLYWYHPHLHTLVNREIAEGLSGGIVVGDVLAPFPALSGITQRLMLLKDLKIRHGVIVLDPDPSGRTLRTINGLFRPRIGIRPGELQLWRIGNLGANIFYRLKLPRHVFYVIAQDGRPRTQLVGTKELVIPPAGRYEVLVRGARPGTYRLRTTSFDTGPVGDRYPGQVLATVVSRGPAVANPIPLPPTMPAVPDLRALTLTGRRTVVFANGGKNLPFHFTIDGQIYDHDRVDTQVTLGAVEEWTVRNTSKELHVFHIHQTYFQVTEVNGVAQPFVGYEDTVTVPAATNATTPGEVKMIIPFTDPAIVGRFVYHCHIAQHADQGMMANIEVVAPPATP
jgi:FtsP/CotA-like multicopper oxidase with cupredoxin domain